MALKISLKAGEQMIVGKSVITAGHGGAELLIAGEAPVLREKDILRPEAADTPCKRLYLTLQAMYLSESPADYHESYFAQLRDILAAAPSLRPLVDVMNNEILTGSLYQALKTCQRLVTREKELMDHAKSSGSLRPDRPNQPATT